MNTETVKDEGQKNSNITITSKIYWKDYLEMKKINTDPEKECDICRKNQVDKFGKITIECNGMRYSEEYLKVTKEEVGKDLFETLVEEEDVVEWAIRTFKNKSTEEPLVKRRAYQKLMTNCTSKRKLYRCGRRVGKTASMVMYMAKALMSTPGYKILGATPFKTQAEELYTGLIKYFENVEGVEKEEVIERNKESPSYYIKLTNGSVFRCFTTGAKGGGTIRGQGADEMFLDEVDLMSEKDFNSIMGILADTPDTKVTVASTPEGERMLYRLSKSEEFKEFHFPTFLLPHYNDKLDATLRKTTDDIGYVQEFMAEFGASRSIVYQKEFLDRAFLKESFSSDDVLANRSRYIASIGCDWNHENIGTRIVVAALDKVTGLIAPIHYDKISKEGWTQTSAINKIIELNRIYNLDHIYVDEGFGYAQVEVIKRFSLEQRGKVPYNHPDIRLGDIKAINSGSSLKVINPIDNSESSKMMKQYMVETNVAFFEEGVISLNPLRDESLRQELMAYVELRRTPNGKIVYGSSNPKIGDHTLDAFILAVYAMHAEYSSLLRRSGFMASIVSLPKENKTSSSEQSSDSIESQKLYNKHQQIYERPTKRNSSGRAHKIFSESHYGKRSRLW